MVKYINLMLQAGKALGTVKEAHMEEACQYMPDRVRIAGVTKDGVQFKLELQLGEVKK